MQEIVDEVLKTEEAASRIMTEARERAAKIRNEAETETSEAIKQAKAQAQTLILEEIARAKEEADRTYKKAIQEIDDHNRHFLAENESKFDHLTDTIISHIIVPEFERD